MWKHTKSKISSRRKWKIWIQTSCSLLKKITLCCILLTAIGFGFVHTKSFMSRGPYNLQILKFLVTAFDFISGLFNLNILVYISQYIYIYIYVCVCVCLDNLDRQATALGNSQFLAHTISKPNGTHVGCIPLFSCIGNDGKFTVVVEHSEKGNLIYAYFSSYHRRYMAYMFFTGALLSMWVYYIHFEIC